MASDSWANRFQADCHIEPDNAAGSESTQPQDQYFPNVDFQHRVYSLVLDGVNYQAPIAANGAPKRILNLGPRTSTWANELATEYPNAEVTVVGPNPIDHKGNTQHPANSRFETRAIDAKNAFEQNAYDFVCSRDVYPVVNDWDTYLQNIHSSLAPGGWAELVEWEIAVGCDDETYSEATACRQFHSTLVEKLQAAGKDITVAEKLKANLERHGFTNVTQKVAKVPMSEWPKDPRYKELGSTTLASTNLLKEYAEAVMGLSPENAKEFVGRARGELAGRTVHVYSRIHFVTAQKPTA